METASLVFNESPVKETTSFEFTKAAFNTGELALFMTDKCLPFPDWSFH